MCPSGTGGRQGIGQGREHWDGNVDPKDGYPYHFSCGELLGITPAHEVLRGLIWPLSIEDKPAMPGLMDGVERSETGKHGQEEADEQS